MVGTYISYFLANTFFGLCVIGGTVYGILPAQRIAIFISWFMVVVALGSEYMKKQDPEYKPKGTVSAEIDIWYDIFIVLVMVAHGWYITGTVYIWQALVLFDIKKGD